MAQLTAAEKAAETRADAEAKAEQAKADAEQAQRDAEAKALAAEQADAAGKGSYVVLVDAFMARTSKENKNDVKRYGQGETFEPLSGVHDVDALVANKTIGKVGGKEPLRRTTALSLAQAAARAAQENSPVIDLQSQPFEVSPVPADDAVPVGES